MYCAFDKYWFPDHTCGLTRTGKDHLHGAVYFEKDGYYIKKK